MRKYPLCCPHPLHLHFGASGDQRAQGRSPHPSDAQNWGGRRAGPDPPPPPTPPPCYGAAALGVYEGGGGIGAITAATGLQEVGGVPLHSMLPPRSRGKKGGPMGRQRGDPPGEKSGGGVQDSAQNTESSPNLSALVPFPPSPPPHIPIALPPPHKHRREGGALSPPRSQWDEQSGGGVPGEGGGGGPEGNGAHSPQGFTSQRRQSTEPNPPHRDRVTATVTT